MIIYMGSLKHANLMGSLGSIDLGLSMGSLSMFHLIHQIEGLRKAHHLPE